MLFLFVPRDSIGNHCDEAGSGAVAKTHHRESPQERTLANLRRNSCTSATPPAPGAIPDHPPPSSRLSSLPSPPSPLPVRPRTPRLINSYLISEARQPGSRFSSCARAVSGGRISRSLRRYTVGPRHIAYY